MILRVGTEPNSVINPFTALFYLQNYADIKLIIPNDITINPWNDQGFINYLKQRFPSKVIIGQYNEKTKEKTDSEKQFIHAFEFITHEAIHVFTIENPDPADNEEIFWLIEGRMALARLLVEVIFNEPSFIDIFIVNVHELRAHLELNAQLTMAGFLAILEGWGHKVKKQDGKSKRLLDHGKNLLYLQETLNATEGATNFLERAIEITKLIEKGEIYSITFQEQFRKFLQTNWMELLIFNPYRIEPPNNPLDSISISHKTVNIYGLDKNETTAPLLLGTFMIALSDLIKEIYQKNERLEDVWFSSGRILVYYINNYVFTLLSSHPSKIMEIRLIGFAKEAIKWLSEEGNATTSIDFEEQSILDGLAYRFFGIRENLETGKQRKKPKKKRKITKEIETAIQPDIILILPEKSKFRDCFEKLEELPYISDRTKICTSPYEIEPADYSRINLVLYSRKDKDTEWFLQMMEDVNPLSLHLQIRRGKPRKGKGVFYAVDNIEENIVHLIWIANKIEKKKYRHAFFGSAQNNHFSKGFMEKQKTHYHNLFMFFNSVMDFDANETLKQAMANEVPSIINYFFNIIRLSLKEMEEKGTGDFKVIQKKIDFAFKILHNLSVRYKQLLLQTYILFLYALVHYRLGNIEKGDSYLNGCRDLVIWHLANGYDYELIQILNFFIKERHSLISSDLLEKIHSFIKKSSEDLLIYTPTLINTGTKEETVNLLIYYNRDIIFKVGKNIKDTEIITMLVNHFLRSIEDIVKEIKETHEEINAAFFRDAVLFSKSLGNFRVILFETPRKKISQLTFRSLIRRIQIHIEKGISNGKLVAEKEIIKLFYSLY